MRKTSCLGQTLTPADCMCSLFDAKLDPPPVESLDTAHSEAHREFIQLLCIRKARPEHCASRLRSSSSHLPTGSTAFRVSAPTDLESHYSWLWLSEVGKKKQHLRGPFGFPKGVPGLTALRKSKSITSSWRWALAFVKAFANGASGFSTMNLHISVLSGTSEKHQKRNETKW